VSEDTLPVHVNREELHALDVPDAFETTGSFDLRLVNHGQSVHVHLHLDDALSEVATIDATNHFVDGQSERAVRVHVDGDDPVRGKLKVASAYGAQTRYVDVDVVEPEETEETVTVDESLSKPQPKTVPAESGDSLTDALVDNPEVLVLGLGGVALVVAIVAALVLEEIVVVLGTLAVLAGVLVAMYVLVGDS
jgi:hypothetical protein